MELKKILGALKKGGVVGASIKDDQIIIRACEGFPRMIVQIIDGNIQASTKTYGVFTCESTDVLVNYIFSL